jgi:hypothetical protein
MNDILSKIKNSYFHYLFSLFLLILVGRIISINTLSATAILILMLGTTLAWFFPRQILYLAGFSFMSLYGDIIWEISIAHFLIFFLALAFALKLSLGKETISKDKMILFSIFFVLFIFFNETIHSPSYAFGANFIRKLGRTLIGISVAVLILSILKTPRTLKVLIYSMIIGICISSVIAILQNYLGEPFWILRQKMGLSNETIDPNRMPGLSADNIQFSFQLCLMIPLIYSLLWERKISILENTLLLCAIIITFLALILNATRSAMVGVASSLFVMGLVSKRYFKLSIVIIIFMVILTVLNPFHQRTFSAAGIPNKIVEFSLAFSSLSKHPFGIGSDLFYSEEAHRSLSQIPYYTWVKVSYAAHNSLLDIGMYYGFPGLFLGLAFYYWIFKRISFLRKQLKDPFLWRINIGILGSFISYCINTSFHNRGFFNGEHFGWVFVGIVLILLQFQKNRYQNNHKNNLGHFE